MAEYNTPLRNRIEKILKEDKTRMYMPGHKGRMAEPFTTIAPYDITEIEGADSLYDCDDVLLELEERISGAYGTGASIISAGGSTLGIQTMLYLSRQRGRKIIVARNIHRIAIGMMGILGIDSVWIPCSNCENDDYSISGIAKQPTPKDIEGLLKINPDAASVYITSPDYFGQMADIPAISDICKKYKAWLIVDNAHGAHLNRFRAALHPILQGADMCCDSFHKNLPVLTGGAVLHLADGELRQEAKYAMSIFGSSSPSYLIMLSIDMALPFMESSDDDLLRLGSYISGMKERLYNRGYETVRRFVSDPLRLAVGYHSIGYTKKEMKDYLHTHGIEPEYLTEGVLVFMPSSATTEKELEELEMVLTQLPKRPSIAGVNIGLNIPKQPLSISEAMNRPKMLISTDDALGKISARLVSKCPPGVPIVVPGEEISKQSIYALKSSGIFSVYVVK